ncbi:hypothetical protein LTS10_001483 [Elasticomyces elasticus]|nr:hypothetical protein LTS10_001483 [Elasticomyces elasticus]
MDSSREPSPFDARAFLNNPDWVELAFRQDPRPLAAAPQGVTANRAYTNCAYPGSPLDSGTRNLGTIVCPDINSIPTGRQPLKNLKCGISGCTLKTLFDRRFELERHMRTHSAGDFPCAVHGCERNVKPFTRPDKLGEHLKKVHGQK